MTIPTPRVWSQAAARPKVQIEARVKEAAAILDLTRYIDRSRGELSGGQRPARRLGRAIVREPAVFLMDEPLSNSSKLRVETRANILRLHQRLTPRSCNVTHDQVSHDEGSRIAVMNEGSLQQVTPQGSTTGRSPFRGRLYRQPGDELHSRSRSVAAGRIPR